jgi:hypothetical protein
MKTQGWGLKTHNATEYLFTAFFPDTEIPLKPDLDF